MDAVGHRLRSKRPVSYVDTDEEDIDRQIQDNDRQRQELQRKKRRQETARTASDDKQKSDLAFHAIMTSGVLTDDIRQKMMDLVPGSVRMMVPVGNIPRQPERPDHQPSQSRSPLRASIFQPLPLQQRRSRIINSPTPSTSRAESQPLPQHTRRSRIINSPTPSTSRAESQPLPQHTRRSRTINSPTPSRAGTRDDGSLSPGIARGRSMILSPYNDTRTTNRSSTTASRLDQDLSFNGDTRTDTLDGDDGYSNVPELELLGDDHDSDIHTTRLGRDLSLEEGQEDKRSMHVTTREPGAKIKAAHKIVNHPNSSLLEGTNRCKNCADAPRAQRECWIVLNDDGTHKGRRCAPCTRVGLTCFFNENDEGEGSHSAGMGSKKEKDLRSRYREMSNEVWVFVSRMQTHAELLEKLAGQLDDQHENVKTLLIHVSESINREVSNIKEQEKNKEK